MERPRLRPWPCLGGLFLVAAYARLSEAVVFRSELGKSFLYLSWRESLFWLSHYLLLLPGLLALAWGISPLVGPWLGRLGQRFGSAPPKRDRLRLLVYGLLLFVLAVVGRSLLLLDLPITNDEHTMRFGAQILAEGLWMAPDIDPELALTMPYVYRRDGGITSMDFPGTLLFKALSLTTGLGQGLFALAVALSGLALVAACGPLDGRRGLAVAAVAWGISPMVATLSLTQHSHLVSRAFVAFAYAVYLRWLYRNRDGGDLDAGAPRAAVWGLLLGLAAACAFLSRPAEAVAVLAPVGIHLARIALDRRPLRPLVWAAAAVAAAGPLFTAYYNHQLTGSWRTSARVLANRTMGDPWWPAVWERLGENIGFNIMMLILWFLGPLGAVLALLGATSGRPGARTCAAAVGLLLALGFAHSDTGIHLVGPIHYSEAAVPLLILTVLGWGRFGELFARLRPPRHAAATLAAAYLLSLGVWHAVHAGTLVDQALVQRAHLDAVADLDAAVVVADRPHRLWFLRPEIGAVSSWVAELPHPDPFLRDPVLFAYPEADLDLLRRRFPDRRLYRMTYAAEGPPVRVEPLD